MAPEERIANAFDGWIQNAVIAQAWEGSTAVADPADLRDNLVAAVKAAVAEEREACAKMLDERKVWCTGESEELVIELAAAIRARGDIA